METEAAPTTRGLSDDTNWRPIPVYLSVIVGRAGERQMAPRPPADDQAQTALGQSPMLSRLDMKDYRHYSSNS